MPSWYVVKSTMSSRRLAGHSSNVVARDRERQQPTVAGDLGQLHALLAVLDPVLALQLVAGVAEIARPPSGPWSSSSAGSRRCGTTEQSRNRNRYLRRFDLQHRVGGAVDGEDVADEAVVREVLEERLAPPLRDASAGCRPAGYSPMPSWMSLCIVTPSSKPGSRRTPAGCRTRRRTSRPAWSVRTTGQLQALALVARRPKSVLRVVDRVQPDHALVDVRAGVVHAVVVEPEEALLLRGRHCRPASSGRGCRHHSPGWIAVVLGP